MKAGNGPPYVAGDPAAKRAGSAGGKATRRRLTMAYVERQLGELKTPEDARRRLDQLCIWAAAGLLPGAVAGACVRSCEVWLKGLEVENGYEEVQRLRDMVAGLRTDRDRLAAELVAAGIDPGAMGAGAEGNRQ